MTAGGSSAPRAGSRGAAAQNTHSITASALSGTSAPSTVKVRSRRTMSSQRSQSIGRLLIAEVFIIGIAAISIAATGPIDPLRAGNYLYQSALGLKHAHDSGLIHRDIKPANVIKLNDPNRPFVLIDLGIAFGLLETGLTYNAAFRGPPATFRYLAPEMANPAFRSNLDYRSDLYTSALTCFEYAAGQHPIARDSDDMIRTVTRAIHDAPKPLQDLRPEFSPAFCKLIDQLLKKKPSLRPANLDSLIKQMEA